MPNWPEATIAEIAAPDGVAGGPFGSELGRADYVESGVPVIRGGNLGTGDRRFDPRDFVFVSDAKADELARNLAIPGDIIVTQRGTLGQVGVVPRIGFERFVISQSQMRVRCNPAKAVPAFLYYWLLLPTTRDYINGNAVAAGVPHINLGFLRSMRLRLPPIPDQRAIAHVLSTIDDRIELNRRMNTTLDAMARAFFKSWFVDFDPVRTKAAGRPPAGMDTDTATLFPSEFERSGCGDIPKGWTIGPLANLASLNPESWTRSSRPAEIKYVDLSHPLI